MEDFTKASLLNIGSASKYLGVSIDTIRRWVKRGKLSTYRSQGGHRYFKTEDLDLVAGQRYKREGKANQPTPGSDVPSVELPESSNRPEPPVAITTSELAPTERPQESESVPTPPQSALTETPEPVSIPFISANATETLQTPPDTLVPLPPSPTTLEVKETAKSEPDTAPLGVETAFDKPFEEPSSPLTNTNTEIFQPTQDAIISAGQEYPFQEEKVAVPIPENTSYKNNNFSSFRDVPQTSGVSFPSTPTPPTLIEKTMEALPKKRFTNFQKAVIGALVFFLIFEVILLTLLFVTPAILPISF